MKKLYIIFILFVMASFGCEVGPQGPPGFDGLDGQESFTFEYELSFTSPDYSAILELPQDFTMLESDVMLVYFLWEVTNEGVEVWRPLPQTLYFQDGILDYNFDFTRFDASVFLDGNVNFDVLGADYTDNWIARVVVVPAQFTGGRSAIDFSDYDQVKSFFNLAPSKLANQAYTVRPK